MNKSMPSPTFPTPLEPGDTIGVAAPSSTPLSQPLEQGVNKLQENGFQVVRASNLDRASGFSAGPPELRTREILRLFSNPDVDAVFCARGGNGAVHILDRFINGYNPSHPKPFVGYSDITLLQMGLFACENLVTFSGPMVATDLGTGQLNETAEAYFWHLLTSTHDNWSVSLPMSDRNVCSSGTATGPLLGGCLSLFHLLQGTRFRPNLQDAILVLEDVDEVPYRIDRMLHHLRLGGVLQQISGLILGNFDDCFPDDHSGPTLREIVRDALPDGTEVPIVTDVPYGHNLPSLHTLPLGAPVRLRTDPPSLDLLASS